MPPGTCRSSILGGTLFFRADFMTWTEHPWTESAKWYGIVGKECRITIEPRPNHCDRGHWLAKIFPSGLLALDMDHADAWPRYYFDLDCAKSECEQWLIKRGQVTP